MAGLHQAFLDVASRQSPVDGHRREHQRGGQGCQQDEGRVQAALEGVEVGERIWNGKVGKKPAVSCAPVCMTRQLLERVTRTLRSSRSVSVSWRSLPMEHVLPNRGDDHLEPAR